MRSILNKRYLDNCNLKGHICGFFIIILMFDLYWIHIMQQRLNSKINGRKGYIAP